MFNFCIFFSPLAYSPYTQRAHFFPRFLKNKKIIFFFFLYFTTGGHTSAATGAYTRFCKDFFEQYDYANNNKIRGVESWRSFCGEWGIRKRTHRASATSPWRTTPCGRHRHHYHRRIRVPRRYSRPGYGWKCMPPLPRPLAGCWRSYCLLLPRGVGW